MTVEKKLIDTNIIVYAYDITEIEKHPVCKAIVKEVWLEGGGIVTLQNLMEFFVAVTRKVEKPLPVKVARIIVEDILQSEKWIVVDRNENTFLKAMELVEKYNSPFWDSLIAASMLENDVREILTENTKDFGKIAEIKVVNPFQR
jgi:predicted nucleic acid-binding protein